jgi:hypothetical protein
MYSEGNKNKSKHFRTLASKLCGQRMSKIQGDQKVSVHLIKLQGTQRLFVQPVYKWSKKLTRSETIWHTMGGGGLKSLQIK